MHVGEPVEPPPVLPARGPPTEWTELVQGHDDRDVMQASPDELPVIDIHSQLVEVPLTVLYFLGFGFPSTFGFRHSSFQPSLHV